MKSSVAIFIYLDAFDSRLLKQNCTPFLASLLRSGHYRGRAVENVIGYSFSIQSSMLSGKYPDESGYWLPYCFSPRDSPLLFKVMQNFGKLLLVDHVPRTRSVLTRFLRALFMKKGVPANNIPLSIMGDFMFFPYYYLDELPSFKELGDLMNRMHHVKLEYVGPPQLKGDAIYDNVMKKVAKTHDSQIVVVYDDRLDSIAHSLGPSSDTYERTARHIDMKLQQLHQIISNSTKDPILIFFSDHSQCDLYGSIDIVSSLARSNLKIGRDYVCFVDATLSLFWTRSESAKERITTSLRKLRIGTLVDAHLRKKYHLRFRNMELYGHIIYILKPGWSFFPNNFSQSKIMNGLHGYMPYEKVQKAFIIMDKRLRTNISHVRNLRAVLLECCEILE